MEKLFKANPEDGKGWLAWLVDIDCIIIAGVLEFRRWYLLLVVVIATELRQELRVHEVGGMHGDGEAVSFCWSSKRTTLLAVTFEEVADGRFVAGGEGGGERLIALDCATSSLSV